jgi:hypothetical protein
MYIKCHISVTLSSAFYLFGSVSVIGPT